MTASRAMLRAAVCLLTTTVTIPSASEQSAPMVRIPGATIQLGIEMDELLRTAEECSRRQKSAEPESCAPELFRDELQGGPTTRVFPFAIDRREVSVADYALCVRAGRCRFPHDPRRIPAFRKPELPMVFVSYSDAQSYCRFVEKRLPTEAEFELAARGEGLRRYPWGNLYHHQRANAGRSGVRVTDDRDGYELLAPTTALTSGSTPQGVQNLAGNAAEWVASRYASHGDSKAAAQSRHRVIKGGSFMSSPAHLRGSARAGASPSLRTPDTGFRCARSVTPQKTHSTKSKVPE